MNTYEKLSHQAGVLALIRQRRLFYQMRRAGTLTEQMVRDELSDGFWLHFGFHDAKDYLMAELHYTEEEMRHLLEKSDTTGDQNGQSDRKDSERTSSGANAGPENAGEEQPLW